MVGLPMVDSIWRHKKRGTLYRVGGVAVLQIADDRYDMSAMVVYESLSDGVLWVRPLREFIERFEHVIDRERPPVISRRRRILNKLLALFW